MAACDDVACDDAAARGLTGDVKTPSLTPPADNSRSMTQNPAAQGALATAAQSRHRIYFVPGMFGFGQLAGYDYFHHVQRCLAPRFRQEGLSATFHDVPSPPTSSLKERARVLATTIAHTSGTRDPIHIIGHSTGGLDARLALSPRTNLGIHPDLRLWVPRVQNLVTLNTPHFGTPLAGYFTTVSGTRLLYALSLLTVVSLKLGEPSLAIFSRLLASLGGLDSLLGGDLRLVSRITTGVLRFVDKEARSEIRSYLSKVQTDQGAVIQITPEAMDLFNAAVVDAEHVRYGCVVAGSPRPATLRAAKRIRSPYMALTAALYTTLYQFTAQAHERYGYAEPTRRDLHTIREALQAEPTRGDSDGIVPTLSMLWGELVWATEGDHLDTLGHFHDDLKPVIHTDWLNSGSRMARREFGSMMDRVAWFLLGQR